MDVETGGRAIIATFIGVVIISITLNAVTEINPILIIISSLVLFALLAVWAFNKPRGREKESSPPD